MHWLIIKQLRFIWRTNGDDLENDPIGPDWMINAIVGLGDDKEDSIIDPIKEGSPIRVLLFPQVSRVKIVFHIKDPFDPDVRTKQTI